MSILGRNNDIDEISLHLFSLLTSPPICAKLHIQNGTNLILIFCINLIQNVLSSILPKLDCCNNLINGDMIYDDTYIYSDPKQASNHWDWLLHPTSTSTFWCTNFATPVYSRNFDYYDNSTNGDMIYDNFYWDLESSPPSDELLVLILLDLLMT